MSLALEVQGGSSVFVFDVQGALEPRLEPVWKEAAEPPELTELREVWELRSVRLVASDGDPATCWAEWTAFLARLRIRGRGFPTVVRLVRDPRGARQVVWTLGPPTHERFRIDQLGAGPDDAFARATWNVLVPFTLVVSAVQRFADVNGIVGWEQEVSSRFDAGGLHLLEWRTRITTREGTSAIEKARRFGRIDVRPFGGSYTYDTNGPDGVEDTATDADEVNQRVPTVAEVVSRVRQWGVHVGTTGPGTSPTEVSYSVQTQLDGKERSTTVRATARGPRALAWVEGHAPSGTETSEILHEEALRYAEGTWTTKESLTKDAVSWQIQTELSGGHEDFDFEPITGGYEPVLFEGAILPWRLTVTLKGQRRGGKGALEELPFPGLPGEPWRLDYAASREQEPQAVDEAKGKNAPTQLWTREASLVLWSATRPTTSPLEQIQKAKRVRSYYL